MAITDLVFLALYLYIMASTGYLLVFAILGRYGKAIKYSCSGVKKKIAVLIPAYKEDKIIVGTVQKAVAHNYALNCFSVVVIADTLQPTTLQQLRMLQVQVLEVAYGISTKAKSLHAALHTLPSDYFDIAMILDADNIMEINCLEKINDAFNKGCKAVQCHRIAKNTNNPVALLDAISGEINMNIFRKGPSVAGLSAAPAGSGMAVDFSLMKEIYNRERILHTAAEDRETDVQLMKAGVKMHYINDAYVYDEKVSDRNVFKRQRTRWFEAQIHHCLRFFDKDMQSSPRTADYYNKFIQTLLLPRLLYLIVFSFIVFFFGVQKAFGFQMVYPGPYWWFTLMAAYCCVLLVSIPPLYWNRKTIHAIGSVPALAASMIMALFAVKKNRREFLHTAKTFDTDENQKGS